MVVTEKPKSIPVMLQTVSVYVYCYTGEKGKFVNINKK
jgi:hypothetical protein